MRCYLYEGRNGQYSAVFDYDASGGVDSVPLGRGWGVTDSSDEGGRERDDHSRRRFLGSVATAVGGGLAAELADRDLVRPAEASDGSGGSLAVDPGADPDAVFPQSVMSGGPTTSGVILWTRIAPEAYDPSTPVGVEVAADGGFEEPVLTGSVPADRVTPRHDYVLKVDLDGRLESDRHYHYRFVYDGTASRTGRCRTLPASEDDPEEVSVGVLACQDYQNGYYGAYARLAEAEVDFLVHLGDFVYESAEGAYLAPDAEIPDDRAFDLPSGEPLAETLADFRTLYRTYKSDPLLQRGLERHTLIAGWDDHEIGNNRYWDYAAGAPVLPAKEHGGDPEFALELTANGIQAWVEQMPARVEYDPTATDLHEQFRLWRTVEFGDLVELVVTDERLYREQPPCPDGAVLTCFDEDEPGRTMLSDRQKAWWKERVAGSGARWTAWLNEVLSVPITAGTNFGQVEFLHDSWDGYQAERYELMQHLRREGPRNFVALTGDLHASVAGYMHAGYGEVEWQWSPERVGVELMTPAVTSTNAANLVDFPTTWDGEALNDIATVQNDHLEYVDWYRHGYAVVTFTREECRYTVYEVETGTDAADAKQRKIAEYTVPDGEIRLREEYNRFEENAGSDLL
jgi:alkaline phosphatase D